MPAISIEETGAGRDAMLRTVEWCRASVRIERHDGRSQVWDSGLGDAADHVDHLMAVTEIVRREAPSADAAAEVRVLLTVQRGSGGACAITVPDTVIADLAASGAFLWIDAYQDDPEDPNA